MPLYEYKCGQCGQIFEVRQNFSDAPVTVHEGCGGAVEKLLSAPALQFKGTGWYITDYARGGGRNTESTSKGETKPETKSESSPASGSGTSSTGTSGSTAKSDNK